MRRGISLIEMIAVITVGAVLMGVAMSLLVMLLKVERTGRAHVEQSAAVYALADQFRRDVRAADRAAAGESKGAAEIVGLYQGKTRVVRYESAGGDIQRVEKADGKMVRRESYALPSEWSATVDVESKARPEVVRMTLGPKEASMRATREVRIEAALGQDHRFERREEGKQ
jgi:type II secretory pathway component PulJ